MSYMFDSCKNLISLNLSNFNMRKVTDVTCMFRSSFDLKDLNLWKLDINFNHKNG